MGAAATINPVRIPASTITSAAALLAVGVSLSACGERSEQTAATAAADPVTVVLAGKPSAADACLFQAQSDGNFQKANLAVNLVVPQSPAAPLEMLGNGRALIAATTPTNVLTERRGGAPYVAVALLTSTPIDAIAKASPRSVKAGKGHKAKAVAGAPTPLVLVSTEAAVGHKGSLIRRLLQAAGRACAGGPKSLAAGRLALSSSQKANPTAGQLNPAAGPPITVPLPGHPWGWQPPQQWAALDARLRSVGALAGAPSVGTAFSNEFLAGQGG
jgi:NMT1/THI5 like